MGRLPCQTLSTRPDIQTGRGPSIDLFCRVIDNFGDAGVALRLARRLADLGQSVRLWMDQVPPLGQPDDAQRFAIHLWSDPFPAVTPHPRVMALFGARLPERYLEDMAHLSVAPTWINLEYLTAEAWATGCHGLASPHPRLPLTEYFFFPGVTPGTGGVVIEPNLDQEWAHFDRTAFLTRLGIPRDETPLMSLFSYDNAALDDLIDACSNGPTPGWRILSFVTPALPRLARCLGRSQLAPGDTIRQGALELRILPWLSQDDYDRLLWSCDLNIVRGEDSFVRAQLAGRPLLWQPYVQSEAAHLAKLDAFLEHYTNGLPESLVQAVYALHHGFNQETAFTLPSVRQREDLKTHAQRWRQQILARGDLAEHLLTFKPNLA